MFIDAQLYDMCASFGILVDNFMLLREFAFHTLEDLYSGLSRNKNDILILQFLNDCKTKLNKTKWEIF